MMSKALLALFLLSAPLFAQETADALLRAKVAFAESRYQDAAAILDSVALADSLLGGELVELQATALHKAGQSGRAIDVLRTYIAMNPESLPQRFRLGSIRKDIGSMLAAEQTFRKILALDETHAATRTELAMLEAGKGNWSDVVNLLSVIDSLDAVHSLYLARAYRKLNIPRLSIGYYAQVLHAKARSVKHRSEYAAYLLELGYTRASLGVIDDGICHDSSEALLYRLRGRVLLEREEFFLAQSDLFHCLALGDSSSGALREAGIACYKLEDYEQAHSLLLQAVETARTSDNRALFFLALTLRDMQRNDEALMYLSLIVETEGPPLSKVFAQLGYTYKEMRDYPAAVAAFKHALVLDADPVNLNYELARLYDERLDNSQQALHYYEAYVELLDNDTANTYSYAQERIGHLKGRMLRDSTE